MTAMIPPPTILLEDINLRSSIARELPHELYIETTNRCNLKCRTCPQYFGMAEEFADLTLAQVERIIRQFLSVRRIVLHGIGEPLLNKDLPAIIRAVKAHGAHALFNSNGLLLRGHLVEPIVDAGLDEVRVSVDSASAETYKLVRGVDGFATIIANLHALAGLKQRLGTTAPRVSLWITGMKTNVGELPQLVRLAHEIGVAEVYLQRLVYSGRGLAVQDEALYGQAGEAELDAVHEAEVLARELGVSLRGSGEATAGALLPDGSAARSYTACRRPWSLMYVTANGNVLPCCIAPFTGAHYDGLVLGNVFEQSVEEIWNGQRYHQWRAAMLSERPPEACAGCGEGWSL
ncbi:MAG: SPASM domain-containing protein [Dehalococcoidia bacterium]|nr:SPASM domain-containing protein [Dehalococcoidia bacterium]